MNTIIITYCAECDREIEAYEDEVPYCSRCGCVLCEDCWEHTARCAGREDR